MKRPSAVRSFCRFSSKYSASCAEPAGPVSGGAGAKRCKGPRRCAWLPRESNSHLRCSNSDCAHAVHLHHFAGHDMQRLRKMQYFALHPETAHHFPACIHLPPLALQNVNLRCAAEFHAQARQENGDGILLTAKLDRKFFPFSPQRADEIPRKAAESDCAGRGGRCRSAHNESGRRCQLQRRGQMQEHFGSAQGHSLRGYGQVQRAEIKF